MRRCQKEGGQEGLPSVFQKWSRFFSSQHMNNDLQALSFPQSERKIPEGLGSAGFYLCFERCRGFKPNLSYLSARGQSKAVLGLCEMLYLWTGDFPAPI